MNVGYDYEQADEEIKELVCPICFLLIRDALELECGHSLCSICLEQWELKVKESTILKFECPNCKRTIVKNKAKTNETLNRIITTSIKIKCPYHEQGCCWTDVISNVEDHLKKYCDFVPIPCTNEGCSIQVAKQTLDQHKETCPFRLISCQFCHKFICFCDSEKHLTECDNFELKCTNSGCSEILKRVEMKQHFDVCPYQLVECQFHDFGCYTKVARYSMDAHCKQNIESHLALVTYEVRAIKDDHKKQVSRLQEELIETKQVINDLRSKLADYQQTNEIEQRFRKNVDTLIKEMKETLTEVENDRDLTGISIEARIRQFDQSFDLLEGNLDKLNQDLSQLVEDCIDKYSPKIQTFKDRDIESMLIECIRYTLGRDFNGQLTVELKEKFKLPLFIGERKSLLGKLYMEFATIQALFEEFTFLQRFTGLMKIVLPNVKTECGQLQFLIKLQSFDCFHGEWTVLILKKQSVFSEFNAEKHQDILITRSTRTVAIFLGDNLFNEHAPSVSVCSPRGKYKLRLPTLPKDDFRFRINFTTLITSNYQIDGCFLLHITDIPKWFTL